MSKGKLVVIEGSDGSGKGTQVTLLQDYCKSQHIPHALFDFPQYYKTFFGKWIGKFLKGEFGDPKNLPPHILTIPYAADRWQAKDEITDSLSQGKLTIINRYAGSNAAYQSARMPKDKRKEFVDWSFQMEYEEFGIPREDLVIFLYVPRKVSQALIAAKDTRKYLGKAKQADINESDDQLLSEVETVYLNFCSTYRHWVKIDCTRDGAMLSREEIHQKILETLRKKKFIL